MIAFDNGPRDGDYVRYIEDLVAARAATLSSGASLGGNDGAVRGMVDSTRRMSTQSDAMSTAPQDGAARLTPAAAAAIASALMSGRQVPGGSFVVSVIGFTLGLLLSLVGVFMTPFNTALVIGGVALLAWAIKRFAMNAQLSQGATALNPSGDTRRSTARRTVTRGVVTPPRH